MNARLVIDDLPWSTTVPDDGQVRAALEDLRELLALAGDRRLDVVAHDSLYETAFMGGLTVNELLGPDIPRDLRVELLRRLSKVRRFPDDEIEGFDVCLPAGNRFTAPTVYWAATRPWTVGCLTPTISQRSGEISVDLCDNAAKKEPVSVFFVDALKGVADLFRHAIVRERANETEFQDLAPQAYPGLLFCENALRGCRDLSKNFKARRDELMLHLAVLNDHGASIFALGLRQDIENQFRAHGIHISPENSETLRDAKCLAERPREVLGESIIFNWHSKIEPHIDRIYFHPPVPASEGRMIVGIIHRHLCLPGD